MKGKLLFTMALLSTTLCLPSCNKNVEKKSDFEYTEIIDSKIEMKLMSEESKIIDLNYKLDNKKYLRILINSKADILGEFVYSEDENSKELKESFFIKGGENDFEFRQFLDVSRVNDGVINQNSHENKLNIGQARKAKYLKSIVIKNLSSKEENIVIKKISCLDRDLDTSIELFLENKYYKIGASLSYGGALTYLEDLYNNLELVKEANNDAYIGINALNNVPDSQLVSNSVNLIDTHDTGRLVQQSYYGTDEGYSEICYNGQSWSYNPVQGGDVMGNISQIIDYQIIENEIYIKTRPMDWAMDGHTTPSYMENRYRLENKKIIVSNSFIDWSGVDSNRERDQEMPALYTHFAFTHLVTYRGSNPWKDEQLSIGDNLPFWPEGSHNLKKFNDGTENWIMWTNKEMFGIGLYVDNVSTFYNGSYHGHSFNAQYSDATNYSAPLIRRTIKSYQKYDYSYVISIGNVIDVRNTFKDIHKNKAIVNKF